MQGAKAVEIFELARQGNNLPEKMEDLVPLSFIGQAAVSFFRQRLNLMDQLNMTEKQRQATLKDGQDAGGLLLDIESRIGAICRKEKKIDGTPILDEKRHVIGSKPSGSEPKHKRVGLPTIKRMQQAIIINKNEKIVAEVKAKAIEDDDIPSKAAVINEVRYRKEKARRERAENKVETSKMIIAIDEQLYIDALHKALRALPQKPHKTWSELGLKQAKVVVKLILKRLEVFNENVQ